MSPNFPNPGGWGYKEPPNYPCGVVACHPATGYNSTMNIRELHSWQLNGTQARQLQLELAGLVSRQDQTGKVRRIAGADIAAGARGGIARGAVVVLSYPELELAEVSTVEQALGFPYIPGLLSFRESPLVLAACRKLTVVPDLLLVDGQGIAHPRRMGLASHLGLLLDTPTIGCAKSRLCGEHGSVGAAPGDHAEIRDNGEVIGVALRTRADTAPLYVSIGHKVDLAAAIKWVLACCRDNRLPEPTRLAHLAASGQLKQAPCKPPPPLESQQGRLS